MVEPGVAGVVGVAGVGLVNRYFRTLRWVAITPGNCAGRSLMYTRVSYGTVAVAEVPAAG